METLSVLYEITKPWLMFIGFIYVCLKMIHLAKNRKAGAIAFGLFLQMFIPDPKAQITIEAVVERKQEVKKQQDGNAKPKDDLPIDK
ncbi:hypothetical protein L0668_16090 [Paraglaciecola aquimarina]|uniref:DUF2897 domain-containing protein n=1 Tax=Paraglaciecola algarum TaxID=3050085 RepID=A0ABS9DC99_9ALTE|nr:hypothetical protein [Paraglaciecola sp. G1-23]MCF2949643.1 hypothetical protein [Paraglaciecola sp. G1-23]